MTVDSITPLSMFNDIANIRNSSEIDNVEKTLNKIYFEIMLKSAFDLSISETAMSSGMSMYTDVYVQNMINQFTESHQLGFGQLQLSNDTFNKE